MYGNKYNTFKDNKFNINQSSNNLGIMSSDNHKIKQNNDLYDFSQNYKS